jgi:predicted  nucleic acid-binding Zn-ribbon protein
MNLARKVKATVAERERELPLISVAYLAAYQQVVKRTAPPAVVAIRNGRCLGCQVTIPANLIKAAEEGKLVFCDSCTRILCPS